MSGFYKQLTMVVNNKPLIIYPCEGLEKILDRTNNDSISDHLVELYAANNELLKVGEYHIVILWDEATDDHKANSIDVMTDVWIFDNIESWGAGPLVDVKIFRNLSLESGIGVTTGNGLLVLGKEEELRRNSIDLEAYLRDRRALLPKNLTINQNFYQK